MTQAGGYRFFAGWRSDPFFFDAAGALNDLQFTGADFFADKDVGSIVMEVPNADLGSKAVALWARTLSPEAARAGTGCRRIEAHGTADPLPAGERTPTSPASR